jgi:hypothetical protein
MKTTDVDLGNPKNGSFLSINHILYPVAFEYLNEIHPLGIYPRHPFSIPIPPSFISSLESGKRVLDPSAFTSLYSGPGVMFVSYYIQWYLITFKYRFTATSSYPHTISQSPNVINAHKQLNVVPLSQNLDHPRGSYVTQKVPSKIVQAQTELQQKPFLPSTNRFLPDIEMTVNELLKNYFKEKVWKKY